VEPGLASGTAGLSDSAVLIQVPRPRSQINQFTPKIAAWLFQANNVPQPGEKMPIFSV
jgi:hypothetical protein